VPSVTITEFTNGITGSPTADITRGPDGNLWFTEANPANNGTTTMIGRITPQGQVTEFTSGITGFASGGITAGPDGNLWFTEANPTNNGTTVMIGKITPQGQVTEFSNGITGRGPATIAAGPDGNLWFTEANPANNGLTIMIGRITPQGQVTEFSSGITGRGPRGHGGGVVPTSITAGPDNNLWFTEANPSNNGLTTMIGRITPQGQVTEFSSGITGFAPAGITAGPDGNLWFTEANPANNGTTTMIGRITPQGGATEFTSGITGSPATSGNARQTSVLTTIAAGPDGNLWFTEANPANNGLTTMIGQITPQGLATEFTSGITGFAPGAITAGPNGDLWFTEANPANNGTTTMIGQLQLNTTTTLGPLTPAVLGQAVVLTATVASAEPGSLHGYVSFYDGNALLGIGALSGNFAAFCTNSLAAGAHQITASYNLGNSLASSTSAASTQLIHAATHFQISGPTKVKAGAAFNLAITALTSKNKPDTQYVGTVTITSTDPAAHTLVVTYTFKATEKGKHIFKGLVLPTSGSWTITVQDTLTGALQGSRTVKVQ